MTKTANPIRLRVKELPTALVSDLEFMLEHYGVLKVDLSEHEELTAKFADEEKNLSARADLNDPESFRALSDLRLKRELLPGKLSGIGDELQEAEKTIKGLCDRVRDCLLDRLDQVFASVHRDACKALQPLFVNRPNELSQAARAAACSTNCGVEIERFGNDVRQSRNQPVFLAAKFLIRNFKPIFELAPELEQVGKPLRIRTPDELEREELASLLEDREPHILYKLSTCMATPEGPQSLLSREKAEESVKGRLKYLLEKFPDAAPGQAKPQPTTKRR